MGILYGRAGRLTAKNAGFWPGQVRGVVRRGDGLLRMYKWGTGRTHGQCQIGGPVDIPKGVACHHCASVWVVGKQYSLTN
jgi:hypothetical protein